MRALALIAVWLLMSAPVLAQGAATVYVQESAPTNPSAGAIWFQPSSGAMKVVENTAPLTWGIITAAASTAWGGITGTLADQADLQTALNGKQAAGTYATGTGTASGTNTGDQTSVSGNAGTATALQNARTINGVSFNGTANITVAAEANTLAGTTLAAAVVNSSLNVLGAGATLTTTGNLGYAVGSGGTVTQATSKATGVTLNTKTGAITLNAAALAAAAEVSFIVTNSQVAAPDTIIVNHASVGTGGAYVVAAHTIGAGSFRIMVGNVSAGSLSEAIVIRFTILKSVSS